MPEIIPATTIRYAFVPSPIEPFLVAAVGKEVVQVAFENQNFERVLQELHARFGQSVERDDDAHAFATERLDEYFVGPVTALICQSTGALRIYSLPVCNSIW